MLPTHAHTSHENLHVVPADKDLATNNNFVTTKQVVSAAVMSTVGVTAHGKGTRHGMRRAHLSPTTNATSVDPFLS
jgi:hypothetical protein